MTNHYEDATHIYRRAYVDTSSEAGSATSVKIKKTDILAIRVWWNCWANPTYSMITEDHTYLMVDDVGAMNGIHHLSREIVPRKKDLIW